MSSRITAYLGLDTTGFERGLDKSKGKANEFSQTLNRKFGAGDAFKGLLQGAGIGTFEKLVEKITGYFKSQAESATKIADESERAAKAQEKRADLGRSDQQKANILKREIGRDADAIKSTNSDRSFGIGDEKENAERVATLTANMEEKATALAELEKKMASDRKKSANDTLNEFKKLSDEKTARLLEQMSLEEKLSALERQRASYESGSQATKGLESLKLSGLAEQKSLEMAKVKAEIEKEGFEKRLKSAEEIRKKIEAQINLEKAADAAKEARADHAKAQAALPASKANALAFSLADAASGKRGNSAAREAARRVLADENTARRLADSGGSVTMFDSATQKNVERNAGYFQERALAQRNAIRNLSSEDKDPFAAIKTDIKASEKHLAEIEKSLKVEQLNDF